MHRTNLVLALLVISLGFAAYGMTADEAVALFQGNEIMVTLSDEGLATLEEMIDAFREELCIEGGLVEMDDASVIAFDLPVAQISMVVLLSQNLVVMAVVLLGELPDARTDPTVQHVSREVYPGAQESRADVRSGTAGLLYRRRP